MTVAELGDGHVRLSLGAYVLGVLPSDEELAVADHLATCPECTADAADLLDVRTVLDRLGSENVLGLLDRIAELPPDPEPDPEPEPEPGTSTGTQTRNPTQAPALTPAPTPAPTPTSTPSSPVRDRPPSRPPTASPGPHAPTRPGGRRRSRSVRVILASMMVALAVGVGFGAWLGTRQPVDIQLAGSDTHSGVSVWVTVTGTPGGARVQAVVEGLLVGESYQLYALGDRGESQLAVSWTAQNTTHGVGGDVTIPIDRITSVTVFRSGEALVTVGLTEP